MPNVPGAMLIPGATFIPESRVYECTRYKMGQTKTILKVVYKTY